MWVRRTTGDSIQRRWPITLCAASRSVACFEPVTGRAHGSSAAGGGSELGLARAAVRRVVLGEEPRLEVAHRRDAAEQLDEEDEQVRAVELPPQEARAHAGGEEVVVVVPLARDRACEELVD